MKIVELNCGADRCPIAFDECMFRETVQGYIRYGPI